MAELTEQYIDMPLGTTDASVTALAERLGITEIATLDRRHCVAVVEQPFEEADGGAVFEQKPAPGLLASI